MNWSRKKDMVDPMETTTTKNVNSSIKNCVGEGKVYNSILIHTKVLFCTILGLFAKVNCTYCQEDINGVRIQCCVCSDFDICLQVCLYKFVYITNKQICCFF